jgi:GNAT superfamily N-acetyltransferase
MRVSVEKGYVPGCIGRICELHARFYSKLVGFGLPFESKVARELAEFCTRYDGQRDGLWLAICDGQVHGSIAIDGLHADGERAHLRWFITSDEIRGGGTGTALLSAAMDFCKIRSYQQVYLWTFAGLNSARNLYEKFGFRLVHQQRGAQWGLEVDEQRFELGEGDSDL